MVRKILTLSLIGALLLSTALAGCAADKNAADNEGGKKAETTTLKVWAMGEEAKSLPKIAEEFEKENPNIKVNVQAIPWDQAHDKLLTAVASKSGPDVIQMGTTWMPEFVAAKALLDLSPYVKDYPELDPKNFYEGAVETTVFDGKTYGAPWYIETRVLFYRPDLLQQVGYSEPPKTWDELKDAAKKLAARGEGKYGISIDTNEKNLGFLFARQNGSKLLDENNKPLFNQKEFVEAVEFLNSFFKDGSAPVDLGLDIIQAFREGIIPMFISGPWMIKLINDQAPDLEGKWATAVLPAKENNMSFLGGSNLTVFQYSNNKEAALKFVAYMSKPETQLKWWELTQSLPAAKEAWNNNKLQENQFYKTFGEQLKNAKPMPLLTQWEELGTAYLQSFEKIYRGGADVQKEMDEFNKKAEEILSK